MQYFLIERGVIMCKSYLGYIHSKGQHNEPQQLANVDEIISFIKAHLYEKEVVITDSEDNLIFRAIDGVDLYSDLSKLGIDLQAICRDVRRNTVNSESHSDTKHEAWEEDYDSIGLSLDEISMRQRAKHACKAARTVADIIKLLEGTYFDAHFTTEERERTWVNFNPRNYSVLEVHEREEEDSDEKQDRTMFLETNARVRYLFSGEDIHLFILLDPPKE